MNERVLPDPSVQEWETFQDLTLPVSAFLFLLFADRSILNRCDSKGLIVKGLHLRHYGHGSGFKFKIFFFFYHILVFKCNWCTATGASREISVKHRTRCGHS